MTFDLFRLLFDYYSLCSIENSFEPLRRNGSKLFAYCHILCAIHENMPKYARFVYGHITPTPKVAGSNPVGHTSVKTTP